MDYLDIIAVIGALLATIVSIYSIIINKNISEKNSLLDNYTAERLRDLHNLKKCSIVILSEVSKILNGKYTEADAKERLAVIIDTCNEYWFILKPLYKRDRVTLKSLAELEELLIDYYNNKEVNEDDLKSRSIDFRQKTFLYIHSSWSCIKNQMLYMERSEYYEFDAVYKKRENKLKKIEEELGDDYIGLWICK